MLFTKILLGAAALISALFAMMHIAEMFAEIRGRNTNRASHLSTVLDNVMLAILYSTFLVQIVGG